MRKEAVLAAAAAIILLFLIAILLGKEFAKDQLTGYSILASPAQLNCPVQDGIVTAGWREQSYYDQFKSTHEGVDFANNGGNAATCGREVRAMAAGTASFMRLSGTAGNYVVIDHGEGVKTRYLHLSGYENAKPGDKKKVKRGELIGYIGSTGKSTGCHLHFEVITNSKSENPLEYVCRQKCGENWCDISGAGITAEEKQLLRYVDKETGLEKDYPPAETLIDLKAEILNVRTADSMASKLIAEDLKAMMADAAAQGIELYVQSAYRSYESQSSIFEGYVRAELASAQQQGNQITDEEARKKANTYSAYPGHSEHQLGTAIDFSTSENNYQLEINFEDTAAGKWLLANSETYGFILSYPKGKEQLTGYQYEPWHYRYIGKNLASRLASTDYKGAGQTTPNSFIKELLAGDSSSLSQKNAGPHVDYDAHIIYEVKPSFKEKIPYDLAEIETVKKTAEEISKCTTEDCVKSYSNREIEGLTWKLGQCEQDDEEKFNEIAQAIEDCASHQDNYCSCGKQELKLEKGYDIILKKSEGTEATLLRGGQEIYSKKISADLQLYSPAPVQRESINELKLSEFCTKSPDFCGKNSEIEIAKFDGVVFKRQTAHNSELPYLRKCGAKRLILVDAAPSEQEYTQKDLFTINTAHYIANALKETDEGLAVTKLSTGIPRGSHADSIEFVNSNSNAQIFITIILDNSAASQGFTIRHSANEKSRQFAQLLADRLTPSSLQETDFSQSNDPKDFLVASTKIYEKDIPVVILAVHNPNEAAKGNPPLQETTAKAIMESMKSYLPNFAAVSRKQLYKFCVESRQKVSAYDKAEDKTEMRPVQYKFAVRMG